MSSFQHFSFDHTGNMYQLVADSVPVKQLDEVVLDLVTYNYTEWHFLHTYRSFIWLFKLWISFVLAASFGVSLEVIRATFLIFIIKK